MFIRPNSPYILQVGVRLGPVDGASTMKKKMLAASIVLLLLMGLGWALLPPGVDPQVAKVTELQQKLFGEQSKVSPEERRQAYGELRQESEKLSPEQRDKLMRDNPPPFARQMQKNIRDYFELPAEQRTAELDRRIDAMEARRREFEKQRGKSGDRPGGGSGFGGGPPGGFGGNRGAMDPQRRQGMAKRMLDNTSPEDRAMMGEYFRQVQDRRKQRGMAPFPGPRF